MSPACKKAGGNIRYEYGDIVEKIPFEKNFDMITAFDVFMHLNEEQQLIKALNNVYQKLTSKGIFVWYECNAKNHFTQNNCATGTGYSKKEMDSYAEKTGFCRIACFDLHKTFPRVGNSVYLAQHFPLPLAKFMEKFIPGPAGNICHVYEKV